MGGNLAWTIRQEDGTEYRMDHRTNPIPGFIQDNLFLHGDTPAIQGAIAHWLALKADWETNKQTGDFELLDTKHYAPYPFGLKPSEYGAVVVDFVNKRILSLQGYSRLGMVYASRLISGPHANDVDTSGTQRLAELAKHGRVSTYSFVATRESAAKRLEEIGGQVSVHPHDSTSFVVEVPGSVKLDRLTEVCDDLYEDVPPHPQAHEIETLETELKALDPSDPRKEQCEVIVSSMMQWHKFENRPFLFANAHLDLDPLTLEEFDDNPDGYRAMLKRIQELNFTLSEDELAAWHSRIKRAEVMDEEGRASD